MTADRCEGYLVGVDVGTGAVRAGIFDCEGALLASAETPIDVFYPQENYAEQSSAGIWAAAVRSVREALRDSGVSPGKVVALGFDATCSLVALDRNNQPLSVSPSGESSRNIIVWMDHRAQGQADRINATGHDVLRYVGGSLSPEQEPPKLKWIKENLPETWANAGKFLDLADYLVFRACGEDVRSLCTMVCKWTYLGHQGTDGAWDLSFFEQIGLQDLFENGKAGTRIAPVGSRAGFLTQAAASELRLREGIAVATGIIDAHAGGLGVLGMHYADESNAGLKRPNDRLALVAGTSSCHLALSREARFINGIWGPCYGAMVPNLWLNEGGQSATGALVDFIIESHMAYSSVAEAAVASGRTVYEVLNDDLAAMTLEERQGALRDLHLLPDFHGNRSPRADSRATGMISGLTLDSSRRNLALLYLATLEALALGTRHIIDQMNRVGYGIRRLHVCGGGSKNRLLMQEHADATGCDVYVSPNAEPVLLGSAMLAAAAAGIYPSVLAAVDHMSLEAEVIRPNLKRGRFLEAKHRVFLQMYEHQLDYRRIMRNESGTSSAGVNTRRLTRGDEGLAALPQEEQ